MKKILGCLLFAVFAIAGFADFVFADVVAAAVIKELFTTYGGFLSVVVILSFLIIWVIRWTKTTKDDEILDKYVSVGIEYAVKIMPKDSKIDWVKFVANALGKFNEVYTKTNELPADAKLYEKAKALIEKITELKQLEQLKNSVGSSGSEESE
jgi:hypothetical protein